jgi:putative hemolysin
MEWFAWSVWPAVWLFEKSVTVIMSWSERRWRPTGHEGPQSEEAALQELRGLAAIARTSRLIGSREEGIIVNAARLANLRVRQIMLPADAISTLDVNDDLTDALIAAHEDMHTRFPVTERPGDPQSILGYVNFKDIVACMRIAPREPSLRSILRPLSRLRADETVAAALEKLIKEHNHIALVRDDAGDVVGMVTLEDVIEELVGEIHDEFDRLPTHITAAGPNWIVGGGAPLNQLERITGLQFPTADMLPPPHVLNDWLVRRLGRPVERGEEIKLDGMRILVRKERRKSVQEAQLSRVSETAATREAKSGAN